MQESNQRCKYQNGKRKREMEEKQGNTKMFRISDKENWHSLSLFYNNFLQNGFVEEKFGPIMIILFLKKDHEGSFSIFECK